MKTLFLVLSMLLLPLWTFAQSDTLRWSSIMDHGSPGQVTCVTVNAGEQIIIAVGPGYAICDFLSIGVILTAVHSCESQPNCQSGWAKTDISEVFNPITGTMIYTLTVRDAGCVSLFLDHALSVRNCEVLDPAGGYPPAYCRSIHPYSGVLLLGPFMNPQDQPSVSVMPGCGTNTNCSRSCSMPSGVAVSFNSDRSYGYYYGFHWQDLEEFPTYGCYCITFQGILPAEMGQFTAEPERDGIRLHWNTLSESELNRFHVLRNNLQIASELATNDPTGHAYSWLDRQVEVGTVYHYELVIVNQDGTSRTVASTEAVSRGWDANPDGYALLPCYPDPFNPTTEIGYEIAAAGPVRLKVFDVHGKLVSLLVNGRMGSGHHQVSFNGTGLPSGLYFYSLETEQGLFTRKMVLLK